MLKKSFVVQFVHYALGTESNGMQQGVRELLEVQSSDAVVIEYRNDQTNNMQKPITCPRSDKVSHSCDVQMGIIWNPETIKLVFLGDILGSLYKVNCQFSWI